MTLPSSGKISLADIYVEIYGSHTTQVTSLRSLSSTAGKSTPDTINEFHGYTHGGGSISISNPNTTHSYGSGLGINTLTSSGAWTAIASDPDGALTGFMSSGAGGGKVTFSYSHFDDFAAIGSITYSLTGTGLVAYWYWCIDGLFETCA